MFWLSRERSVFPGQSYFAQNKTRFQSDFAVTTNLLKVSRRWAT